MKRLFIAIAALVMLAGCSTLTNLAATTVPASSVVVAVNAFDAVKTTASNYIAYCTPNPSPAGCNDAAIRKLIPAVRSGTDARNAVEAFEKAHPGPIGVSGIYDALTSATNTIQAIVAEYGVK